MLYGEIITVYSKNHSEHKYTMWPKSRAF